MVGADGPENFLDFIPSRLAKTASPKVNQSKIACILVYFQIIRLYIFELYIVHFIFRKVLPQI